MVRERRSRNIQFFLNFARNQSAGMSREQQPENCQAGFRAQGRKAVGRSRNQQGVRLLHISIIAEIQKQRQAVFAIPTPKTFLPTPPASPASNPSRPLPTGSGNVWQL